MKTVLLQGDSITDCYRPVDDDRFLGSGYAEFVKGSVIYKNGNEYNVLNRGISGNRVTDLYARVKSDIINLNPDYLSILIGVNDVYHDIEMNNGVEIKYFEMVYSLLVETIKEKLPNIKMALLEPFVLEYTETGNTDAMPDRWSIFSKEVAKRAEIVKRIAEKYNLSFIPLQQCLDTEAKRLGIPAITVDGIHPSATGHRIIAEKWLKWFEEII